MLRLSVLSTLAMFLANYLWGASFIVSNDQDTGSGSLRQAILDLNSSRDSSNTITINPGLGRIQLFSDLPLVTVPVNFTIAREDSLTISGNGNQYRVYGSLPGLTPVPHIQVESSATLRLSGIIDLGTVVSSGEGKLILDGSNTYTGGTIVNNQVDISGTGKLAPTGSLTVNTGIFSISEIAGASQTIGDLSGTGGTISLGEKTFIAGTANDTSYAGVIVGKGNFVKQGTGTLTLTGANTYSGATTVNEGTLLGNTLSLQGNIINNASVVFDQALSGIYAGVISGSGKVIKENVEILTLIGNNTYSGGTVINEGELALSATGTLPSTGAVSIGMDGIFDISDITINSETIGDLIGTGGIELGVKRLILGTSNSTTYSGVINGTGSLVKQGSGVFTLTGSNKYSGGTVIQEGSLVLSGKGSLSSSGSIMTFDDTVFDISGITAASQIISDLSGTGGKILLGAKTLVEQTFDNTTYAGVIEGEGQLVKKGSGILTLSGVNTYSGGTTINGGTIALLGDGSLDPTGSITTTGRANFNISGITATSQTIGALSGTGGNVVLGEKTLITETPNDTPYAGVISGTGNLTKQGSGILSLSGVNTYSGSTTINEGTIALVVRGNMSFSEAVTINQGGSFDISQVADSVQDITINNLSGTGGNVLLGEKPLIVISQYPANYAGVIEGKGSFGKQGPGTLTLTGVSSYTGGTVVNEGVLALLDEGTLASTGAVTINTGSFDISGITAVSQTIGGLSGVGGSVVLGEKTLITETYNRTSYAGEINGVGSFDKQGSGVLTLMGINTYTGGTFINGGVLALLYEGTLASTGAVTINTGSFDISGITAVSQTIGDLSGMGGSVFLGAKKLCVDSSNNTSYEGVISGIGSLDKQGSGVLILQGDNRYSGGTFVHEGTLQGTVSSLQGNIVNNASVVFEEADSGMYGGIFSGSGNLIKQGAGFIEFLNDSSDFTGNVAINEGGLIVTGKLGGLCSVSPNTWIKGTGTLGNDVTNHGIVNEGSVQPGGSIGTLTVNGNYTQADTGELVIEINQSGATDLLQVTGTATLNGLLHISPEPGTYLDSTIYTFLTAGNVTGQFTEVISDIPLNYTVNYFPDKAQLFILGSNITIPPPEGREGIITDHIIKITEVDDPEIKNVIGTLITLPPNKYIKTLNKLTPSQFGGFALNELENNFNVANAFFTRGVDQRSCCYVDACQSTNIWFNPLGSIYSQKSRRGTGFTSHVYGITVGVDHLFDNNWNLGFGLGYSYSHLHWKRNEGEAQANSGYLGPYIKYDCDHFYFNCLLLGAGNFYDTNRKVMFSEFSRIAYSNSTDWDFSEVILAGFKLEPCYNFFVQPEFLLDQCNVFQKSFKESGAGSVNLSVKKKYASFLRSLVNLKLIKEWVCSNTCIIPSINVGWLRTTPLSGRHYKAHFRDRSVYAPNFSTTSFSKVIDQVFAGAQVLFSSQEGLAFSVSYDGKFGGGAKVSEINVALHSSF